MSASGNLIQIAQVLKSNGIGGELVMSFRDFDPEDIQKNEPVFIRYDGLPVPFFIESLVRRGSTRALVRLTDIESFEDAEEIVGSAVYLREEALVDDAWEDGDFSFLEGWTLLDDVGERVGTVAAFIDIPSNPCLEVETDDGRSAMIPLHDDLIVSIEEDSESISLVIPDGLLDL